VGKEGALRTNDLRIVFSERRLFGGTTAIAESFRKARRRVRLLGRIAGSFHLAS
jgi:hypothetical protein